MKAGFEPRYKYFTNGKNLVVAVSRYAGKYVRGIAKCSDLDEFDFEVGKKLAKVRCDLKIAGLRTRRAAALQKEAQEQLDEAFRNITNIERYYSEAIYARDKVEQEYQELLTKL